MRQRDIGSPDGYPQPTSLDLISPPGPFREPSEPVSPTVTLHLLEGPIGFSPVLPPCLRPRLMAAREAAWLRPGESSWINPTERLDWDLPRGLDWTDYPVIGTPRVRVLRGKNYPRVLVSDVVPSERQPLPEAQLFESLQHVVVHLPDDIHSELHTRRRVALEWLSHAMEYVNATPDSVPVTLVADDCTAIGARAEMREMTVAISAWRRFHYSYAANFTAIGLKALEACMQTPDDGAEHLGDRLRGHPPARYEEDTLLTLLRARLPTHVRGMLNPLWLQALYALRRRGEVPVPFLGQCDLRRSQEALVTPQGFSFPAWVGSGRYPMRPLTTDEAWSVGNGLLSTRTVAARGDVLLLSDTGARFLDSIHHSAEDLDMPVRWVGREPDASDGEAMDRWITRTFRKMKTRVNAM